MVLVDGNLTGAAMVNAVITATEAKTRAIFQAGVRLPDGDMATGTTTDAIVIACTGRGKPGRVPQWP
ncbi:MAG: adenosylcobinamide amidohydrolase [Oscillospiraceae bacterium]|nr:adenosylcobinamide amidohydrolase [Oscillospiraceae bacterium]